MHRCDLYIKLIQQHAFAKQKTQYSDVVRKSSGKNMIFDDNSLCQKYKKKIK